MGKVGTAAPPKFTPLRYGDDALLWASWLYYEEGLNQGDVAKVMNVSRPTVNSYLSEARSKGIVNISISPDKLRSLTLGKLLQDHFGLDECILIPGEGGERSLVDRIGFAGAQILNQIVQSGDSIGIGGGRTMHVVSAVSSNLLVKDITVVQIIGGHPLDTNHGSDNNARVLADALGAVSVAISAPAIVSSADVKKILISESIIAEQISRLNDLDKIIYSVDPISGGTDETLGGFGESLLRQHPSYENAVAIFAGRVLDENGAEIEGPIKEHSIGIALNQIGKIDTRVLVAGGYDKVSPILSVLRGGYCNVLVADTATAESILRADGVELSTKNHSIRTESDLSVLPSRTKVKKLINHPKDAVDESLAGALLAYPQYISKIGESNRALKSSKPAVERKVGLLIGGGAGHEPCFFGYVGEGLADVVAVGNIFSSPPPDRILTCAKEASQGTGVLFIYGNYTGDVMNFDMAAEQANAEGINVRTVLTTDDIASSLTDNKQNRRGTAGSIFVFKVAGAACRRMYSLEECERVAIKANKATYTMGIALEPGSLPETQRPSFQLAEDDIEIGVGIHGEPGIVRGKKEKADMLVDMIFDRLDDEMNLAEGDRISLLVNSLGSTPMMELYIINRRIRRRLAARKVSVEFSLVGAYFTSLDMVGVSISLMKLDSELASLLSDPCDSLGLSI